MKWPASDSDTFNSGLGAALCLCIVVNGSEALSWAEELWNWASNERFQLDDGKYQDYMRLLENYMLYDRVDELLFIWKDRITNVFLGGMMDIAAKHSDWKRADTLWDVIVNKLGVKPTAIQICAWSKTHLLCGRPTVAAQILDTLFRSDVQHKNDKHATEYVQAFLLVCHSSPTPTNIDRLQQAVETGSYLIQKDSSRSIKHDWHRLKSVARRLQTAPASLMLHDVLVGWNAKTQSVMKNWPNHAASSNYLNDYETWS